MIASNLYCLGGNMRKYSVLYCMPTLPILLGVHSPNGQSDLVQNSE